VNALGAALARRGGMGSYDSRHDADRLGRDATIGLGHEGHEHAPREHLAQAAVVALGDEQACRVGADVDARAAHALPSWL
jgi:hypothetical protein